MNIDCLFTDTPYTLSKQEKQSLLLNLLLELTEHHRQHCPSYANILHATDSVEQASSLQTLPLLPVRLFKLLELISVPPEQIVKTLTSSGTTSQVVSRIFLDNETSFRQIQALTAIVTSFIGKKRLPMIFVDTHTTISNRKSFSARGTGLVGMSFFGRDHFYLLDENMQVRWQELDNFLEKHREQSILLFGFTFMIWKYLYQPLLAHNRKLDLKNSILIHSGGWKKMQELAIANSQFKQALHEQLGLTKIHNFYGMVEQVGSVYMECEHGYLHAPNFSDIIVRNVDTLAPNPCGQTGLIQVLSALPYSYPGHSLLTEDLGTIWGEDTCACGRKGKFFTVEGRLPAAELRGCSDTHAYDRGLN